MADKANTIKATIMLCRSICHATMGMEIIRSKLSAFGMVKMMSRGSGLYVDL